MCAKNLLHSLYQYKAWSEDVLFRCLKAPISQSLPVEMEKACYWLRHINIVDQLFIARLQGKPEEFDDVVNVRIPRHPDTQPTNIRTPIPRSFGQAVGAQRRRFALLV
ncbi:hypothetical protein [Pseudomonas synxantha]|uniref:hypothetical protein n=1 Tax=Pseudomonas synxantha TaxID=47883 RepID=UPI000A76CD3C|nr:hypothetical protein [Pseudomonas synxantha]